MVTHKPGYPESVAGQRRFGNTWVALTGRSNSAAGLRPEIKKALWAKGTPAG